MVAVKGQALEMDVVCCTDSLVGSLSLDRSVPGMQAASRLALEGRRIADITFHERSCNRMQHLALTPVAAIKTTS